MFILTNIIHKNHIELDSNIEDLLIRSREAFVKIIHERIQIQSQWEIKALMNYLETNEQK